MLMLENLKRNPEIMEDFEKSLMRDKYNNLISEGLAKEKSNAVRLTKEQIKNPKKFFWMQI